MKFQNIVDTHTHTDNSFDGNCPVEDLCESAIAKGIKTVAFTDHIEIDFFYENGFDKTADKSFIDITKAKDEYKDKLKVLSGIELGEATYDTACSEKLLNEKDYDIVLASIHNLRDVEDFYYLDYGKENIDSLLRIYFNELKVLADWAKFDSMAHLTYPLRYIVGEHDIYVDLKKYRNDIDEVLSLLAEHDKALEINTSGLRQKLADTMPGEPIVKRFKELGGKYITVGSDSHDAENMGAGIKRGMEIAKHCGFQYVTIFEKRKPVEIPIK
jgi:histidinol-phosphatase (PHP family)